VGYNRRFAPLVAVLKSKLSKGPVSMVYRINAGSVAADSWIQDKAIGGGRIIGEVCHFIDFMVYISGCLPLRVYASALPDPLHLQDTVCINIEFENGSIGTIAYYANGSKALFKEYIEIYQSGLTAIVKDFKELEIYGNAKPFKKKLMGQDKGQKNMLAAFIDAIITGEAAPISAEDIFRVTQAVFAVLESLQEKGPVKIV